jgi:hypothetical protein
VCVVESDFDSDWLNWISDDQIQTASCQLSLSKERIYYPDAYGGGLYRLLHEQLLEGSSVLPLFGTMARRLANTFVGWLDGSHRVFSPFVKASL